jgi:hypothetical protein
MCFIGYKPDQYRSIKQNKLKLTWTRREAAFVHGWDSFKCSPYVTLSSTDPNASHKCCLASLWVPKLGYMGVVGSMREAGSVTMAICLAWLRVSSQPSKNKRLRFGSSNSRVDKVESCAIGIVLTIDAIVVDIVALAVIAAFTAIVEPLLLLLLCAPYLALDCKR